MGRATNKQRREQQARGAREKAAAARSAQRRAEQRRRARNILSGAVAAIVVVVVIVVVAVTHNGGNNVSNRLLPANASVLNKVSDVPSATIANVGRGSASALPAATADPPLAQGGKPELLFVGGEFCPFCAAERWSVVQALSRFGTFTGLSQINSSEGDLPTFSFVKASYASKYLAFDGVENADQRHDTLQALSPSQQALMSKYTNGYPFLDFGGQYEQHAAGFDETMLSGKTHAQVATAIDDSTSDLAKGVIGEANVLTATICKMTNDQPVGACSVPAITAIADQLHS